LQFDFVRPAARISAIARWRVLIMMAAAAIVCFFWAGGRCALRGNDL